MIGIYPGSYNPFHKGHYNIYQKARKLIDKVFIVRAINPDKNNEILNPQYPEHILQFDNEGILFNAYDHICRLNNCNYTDIICIRGFRNLDDIKYQQQQDYWLKSINKDFKSIYIECDEEFKHLSSSAIRQLNFLKQNTKQYLC